MAALGARTAVRDALSGADAVLAVVSTTRVRAAMQTDADALARLILSAGERVLLQRAVTVKRRVELLAGRLAAKTVCTTVRAACDLPSAALDSIDVRRDLSGAPLCVWPDGTTQNVSIAHAGGWALALSALDDSVCGVDLEPASRHLDVELDGLFHPLERLQITAQSEARRCWSVREAWAKLTARGVAADLDRVATVRAAGEWWLAVPRPTACAAVVAAGENGSIAVAIAIRRDGKQ